MTTSRQDKDFLESIFPAYLLEDVIAWISENLEPGDVFTDADLRDWAEGQGLVEES